MILCESMTKFSCYVYMALVIVLCASIIILRYPNYIFIWSNTNQTKSNIGAFNFENQGSDYIIKLIISNKIFHSSAHVLFNKTQKQTLFIREFLSPDKSSINYEVDTKLKDGIIQLYFDRDPEMFPYILNFLRGYPMDSDLYELSVGKLEKLRSDAVYFGLNDLEKLLTDTLHSRFNHHLCSTPSRMLVSDNGVRVKKIDESKHVSCSVYGVLNVGMRYVEFDINADGTATHMIGVTEGNNFKSGSYPGHPNTKGISLYGANGHIYRNGGHQAWSTSPFTNGDRVGILVDIWYDQENKMTAKISWYINGKKIGNTLDLTQYMNMDNGVIFVVNMYTMNEEVQIVQNPVMPRYWLEYWL